MLKSYLYVKEEEEEEEEEEETLNLYNKFM
jgi:hypothetical protein